MVAAQDIVREAQKSGLFLTATPSGSIKARGPSEVLERLRPLLKEHKAEILDAIRREMDTKDGHVHQCPSSTPPEMSINVHRPKVSMPVHEAREKDAPEKKLVERFIVMRNIVRDEERIISLGEWPG